MRPDLIGERCEAGKVAGSLVMWDSTETNLQGMILLDDGTLQLADYSTMRFPPRPEQPDELRAAAGSVLFTIEDDHARNDAVIHEPLKTRLDRLRKALQ